MTKVIRRLVSATLAAGLLSACEPGALGTTQKLAGPILTDATATAKPPRQQAGEVEAPEVYSTTDEALWDGRPSLGGTWVAAPDAVNPERVVIRNPANGKSVNGALFRRERENPGPPLQISSDAAAALGLLAGQPATISVVALRRAAPAEEPQETTLAAQEPAGEVSDETPGGATGADGAAEVGAVASAAIDEAEGVDAQGNAQGVAPPATGGVPAVEAAPARKGFLAGLFRPRVPKPEVNAPLTAIDPEAATAEAATTEAAATEPAATTAPAPATEAAPAATETVPMADAVQPVVEAQPARRGFLGGLFRPRAPKADTPLTAIDAGADPAMTEPTATDAAPLAVETTAIAPASTGTGGTFRFAVGAFSLQENADTAAASLDKAGLTTTVEEGKSGDKPIWTVYARGTGERGTLLQTINSLGFKDAYLVR